MEKVLDLMEDYFAFLKEFTSIYVQYSFGNDNVLLEKVREFSNINNEKIMNIHENINNLSLDDRNNLLVKVDKIIENLHEEKESLCIELKMIKPDNQNSFDSGMQNIGDKIGIIEHKIYCYKRIICDYLEESKILRKK